MNDAMRWRPGRFQPGRRGEPYVNMLLLQRVLWNVTLRKTSRVVVRGCGIGTASLCKSGFFHAPCVQQSRETIVAFDAARFGINPVFFIALSAELLADGPGPRPHS